MDIKHDIYTIIVEVLNVNKEYLSDDTAIGDLPEWDSLHHLQILSKIETHFGFKFNSSELIELEDISDIIKLTEEKIKC